MLTDSSDSEISINFESNAIYTETLQIANTCSKFASFCSKIRELHDKLISNSFGKEFIVANILKYLYKSKQIFIDTILLKIITYYVKLRR